MCALNKEQILQKCRNISLVITDVDGVLTDGGMYYSDSGESLKKFNTRDGMGVEILLNLGIQTIFLTREKSKATKKRAIKVKAHLIDGVLDKEKMLSKICEQYGIKSEKIAYIGDDVNDLLIMSKVGLSAAPSDCSTEIRQISDYLCAKKGGEGVFREVANLIFNSKKK